MCLDLGEIKLDTRPRSQWSSLERAWQKVNYREGRNFKSYDAKCDTKSFFPFSMPKPFSGGHQTFVSDLLTCQKQHNLRTKCGIIYAEKETLDMKRDKKKKLTE